MTSWADSSDDLLESADPKLIAQLSSRGWVSLSGFAKIVGITYPTALKYLRSGYVQGIRVGGIHRIYAEEIKRFLIEGNAKSTEGEDG